MIRAVIFDLDGVLVDSEQLWSAAREQLVLERGGTWPADATRAPDVYLETARQLDVRPVQCVAVEDSTNGLRAAAAAAMTVVAVPNPHFPPDEEALQLAAEVVDSLRDLRPELIARLETA